MTDFSAIYRGALPGRIAALEQAADRAAHDADAAASVRRIAHALRGSGGTYGYPDVSIAAAAAEDAPDDELMQRVHELLATLRAIVATGEPAARAARPHAVMKLLLVDDDPEIRLLASLVLRGAGHVVTEAASAAQAAERLTGGTFDAVLLDVMLGDDDGVELAFRLLAGDDAPRLVFLTGATRADQQARMAMARPAGILHKPFDPATLASELQRILDMTQP